MSNQRNEELRLQRLASGETPLREEEMLERFLEWSRGKGFELYPAQEEAILEVMAGKHVILNTPTGSGKSLVALAMHFRAVCEQGRSYYTSPIKALVSEKFFDLCRELGAENVGMLTGDASINAKAPVVCCTAEILSNMALRQGRHTPADYVVMDEFHYYADRDRGMAWQVPLLELRDATFMLMSATLGDMRDLAGKLEERTGKTVAIVRSTERPVPLDFEYRDTPLHRTVDELCAEGRAPIYLVNFTQREAAEQAQALTSLNVTGKQEKRAIVTELGGFRFDTPYGKDVRRLVRQGIGLHHAGLLPKYRLLAEQLSQKGLLKVISGTDTLGVGVNIPIRTVLFTKLYKFDGEKMRILSVRDFQQIAGRAGRKGFDERGSVVCQAPEHVIENKQIDKKAAQRDGKKKAKGPRKKAPGSKFVHYDENTFQRLIKSDPEQLRSQFSIDHGVLMNVLDREISFGRRDGGYRHLVALIEESDERLAAKSHHRRLAAQLFRSLRTADLIEIARPDWDPRPYVRVREDLQRNFSLHHTLSLYLVETLSKLDRGLDSYPLDVLTLVESILESPPVILFKQVDKLKGELVADLKAKGVEYEQRMEELEKVTHPKPNEDFIYETFDAFRELHPWMRHDNIRPKSIARDMLERYASFNDYVKAYGLQRSEGVLLRYLSDAYKALVQTVPDELKTDEVYDIIGYFRTEIGHVDSSLVQEWESMLAPAEALPAVEPGVPVKVRVDITKDPRAFKARIRAELHRLVKALADRDYEEAAASVWQPADYEESPTEQAWPKERFEKELVRFYEEHDRILFDHRARLAELTFLRELGPRQWQVQQTLLDSDDENLWGIEALIDLTDPDAADGPLLQVQKIGA